MEITVDLKLSIDEQNLLDMHSVLNVLNVVTYNLLEIEGLAGESEEMDKVMLEINTLGKKLNDKQEALKQIENVELFIQKVNAAIDASAKKTVGNIKDEIAFYSKKLESIFAVLRVRAKEIAARAGDPNAWVEHDIKELKTNFLQVFEAIELNSNGSYHIVGNIAKHERGDYFLTLQIDSENGKTIKMPAIFQDVVRDLIANARKYTLPGGEIIAGIYQDERKLRFAVADSGRGIPESEIENAVKFGYRGTNVKDRPTRGGGFGLTKAYYVTKINGGRMWIDKREPTGTRVEIVIPVQHH